MMNNQECQESAHPSYKEHHARLNRLIGQLEGVKKMIDEQRYCPEILTQLRAIRSAVRSLERNILDSHLAHCVVKAFEGTDEHIKAQKISEIQELIKTFD